MENSRSLDMYMKKEGRVARRTILSPTCLSIVLPSILFLRHMHVSVYIVQMLLICAGSRGCIRKKCGQRGAKATRWGPKSR